MTDKELIELVIRDYPCCEREIIEKTIISLRLRGFIK